MTQDFSKSTTLTRRYNKLNGCNTTGTSLQKGSLELNSFSGKLRGKREWCLFGFIKSHETLCPRQTFAVKEKQKEKKNDSVYN